MYIHHRRVGCPVIACVCAGVFIMWCFSAVSKDVAAVATKQYVKKKLDLVGYTVANQNMSKQ